ncbi:hypothetical protein PR003_g27956 [Phytophthora rubi]|uniref:Uncharacterized protein n=1 Tax=Phytophthora rubi TaxID=129364 RepID=A0A6A4BVT4_9STRA|nr:hypothetical protein PR003_g27956 [Phytophthora rubi]
MPVSTRSNPTPSAPTTTDTSGTSTVPMALFMPLAAPQLKSTSHAALVQWRKLRREYEDEVAMRCNNDAKKMAEVLVSVKKSFNKRLLEVWCEFDWDVDIETVSDKFILKKVDEIISSVKNNSVPDVVAVFKENVTMEMAENDVKERVMQFFARSSLRDEVATIIKYQARSAKQNEKELFKLILTKALEQDRDFQRRKRSRSKDQSERKVKANVQDGESFQPRSKYRKVERGGGKQPARPAPKQQNTGKKGNSNPPTGGCLHCKGDHWLVRCPTATDDEKKELLRKMHERRDNNKGPKRPRVDA